MGAMRGRSTTVLSVPLSLIAGGVLAASLVVAPESLPGWSVCWLRATTGLPCAGCGLTHAFCAIGHGEFSAAWHYHPFGYVFYGIALVLLAGPAIRRCAPRVEAGLNGGWAVPLGAVALGGAMLVFGIARIVVILSD